MSRPPGLRLAWARVPDGMPRRDASRGLLRRLAPDVRFTRRCPTCGSADHGPLRADGDAFLASVTYAGGLAIVGVVDADASGGTASLGIDAEPEADPRREAAGMRGVLGDGTATVRAWTRVEAALKADGRGLRVEPATVVVTEEPDGAGWVAVVPGGLRYRGWDVIGPEGVVLSAAFALTGAAGDGAGGCTR